MPKLHRSESSDAKNNAQRNLSGRTHYVDDDTAVTILKGELTKELETTLMTPDDYLGE